MRGWMPFTSTYKSKRFVGKNIQNAGNPAKEVVRDAVNARYENVAGCEFRVVSETLLLCDFVAKI